MITTQRELRNRFWDANPELSRKPGATQNDYPTDTRVAWGDFVDYMRSEGQIPETLAQHATL